MQAIVLVYGVGVLLVNTVRRRGARAARPALDDPGGLRCERRWMGVLRTPLGLTATVLTVGVLVLAVLGADPVDRRRERRRHQQHPGRTVRRPLGRHRQPRARHLLPHAGGDPALGRARPARDRRSPSSSGCCSGSAPFLLGRRPRPAGDRRRSTSRWPSRACCSRCSSPSIFGVGATGAVLAIGLRRRSGVRPAHPDPGGRRRRSRLRRRRPGRGRGPGAHPVPPRAARTSPSRWSSTPPSAPAARCCPSPGCRSSASACSSPTTTGGGCCSTASARSTSTRPPRSRPAPPCCSPGLAFNLFGETVAKGLGVGGRRRASPALRRRRASLESRDPAGGDPRTPSPTWCSTSATSRSPSPDRPVRSARSAGSRSRYAGARRSASSASPAPASR